MVGQLARRIGREVDRDEWIEGPAEVDAARRAVDERGFGDDFAAGGAHRLPRLARRPAGGHAVLLPHHFRARFDRAAARSDAHPSELPYLLRLPSAVLYFQKQP